MSPTKTQVASSRSLDSDAVVPLQTIQGTYVCSEQANYIPCFMHNAGRTNCIYTLCIPVIYMWQSWLEIEHYSVANFNRTAVFEVL